MSTAHHRAAEGAKAIHRSSPQARMHSTYQRIQTCRYEGNNEKNTNIDMNFLLRLSLKIFESVINAIYHKYINVTRVHRNRKTFAGYNYSNKTTQAPSVKDFNLQLNGTSLLLKITAHENLIN